MTLTGIKGAAIVIVEHKSDLDRKTEPPGLVGAFKWRKISDAWPKSAEIPHHDFMRLDRITRNQKP